MVTGCSGRKMLAVTIVAAVSAGCTTSRMLQKNTIKQCETATDIHQQQVLDNLAKFAFDRNSMPSFSIASGGQSDVNDSVKGGLSSATFNPNGFTEAVLGITGDRQTRQFWTLAPVNNPRKLELMRCAYQLAVANCGEGGPSEVCPDCQKRFNQFYTGRPIDYHAFTWKDEPDKPAEETLRAAGSLPKLPEVVEKPAAEPAARSQKKVTPRPLKQNMKLSRAPIVGNLVELPDALQANGQVTSNCLNPGCCTWFGVGCRKCVPKDCPCQYVGHYCGTYVWVTPGRGRDELAKLTLAILDYAVNEPPQPRQKEVTLYRKVDADGFEQPSTSAAATKVVKVTIPADDLAEKALAYPESHNLLWPRREDPGLVRRIFGARDGSSGRAAAGPPLTGLDFPPNEQLPPVPAYQPSTTLPAEVLQQQRLMFERFAPLQSP